LTAAYNVQTRSALVIWYCSLL